MLQVKYAAKCQFILTPINVRPVRAFSDNYIWLIESPKAPRPRGRGRPGRRRPRDRRVAAQRRKLSRHSTDSPSSRSYRRGPGAAAPRAGARDRAGRYPNCAAHTHRARRRTLRIAGLGTFLRDFAGARAYVKPHRLLGARRAVLRRHAVQRGLRPNVRGYAYANECFVEQAARPAAGHPRVLRPRIHGGQSALRPDGGSGQCRRRSNTRPTWSACAPRASPSLPSTMGLENRVNPFLRCDDPAVAAAAESHAGKPLQRTRRGIRRLARLEGSVPLAGLHYGIPHSILFSRPAPCCCSAPARTSRAKRRPTTSWLRPRRPPPNRRRPPMPRAPPPAPRPRSPCRANGSITTARTTTICSTACAPASPSMRCRSPPSINSSPGSSTTRIISNACSSAASATCTTSSPRWRRAACRWSSRCCRWWKAPMSPSPIR